MLSMLVPTAFQACAHPYFGFSPAILPAVVEECNSAIDCLMNHFHCCLLVRSFAQVMAAESERRDLRMGVSKFSKRYGRAGGLRHELY
jgi:hypothetical protein